MRAVGACGCGGVLPSSAPHAASISVRRTARTGRTSLHWQGVPSSAVCPRSAGCLQPKRPRSKANRFPRDFENLAARGTHSSHSSRAPYTRLPLRRTLRPSGMSGNERATYRIDALPRGRPEIARSRESRQQRNSSSSTDTIVTDLTGFVSSLRQYPALEQFDGDHHRPKDADQRRQTVLGCDLACTCGLRLLTGLSSTGV